MVSRAGREYYAVLRYDAESRQLGEPVLEVQAEDVMAVPDMEFRGYTVTNGLKPRALWLDKAWADLQAMVDEALPGASNWISGNREGFVLVNSESDTDPGRWYLLDTRSLTQKLLLVARPRIQPARMRPMQTLHYAARDGLSIPAYLTLPDSAGPHPLVVMVHGGPTARDFWAWDTDVQTLATRGYAVLQPQFRGSAGFGKAFEEAGYGQWGLAMQDDITDGVEHLVRQGVVNRQRVCIFGASYGGYAAAWGLIKTPDLYRCGITVSGVSDIGYMFRDASDSNSDKAVREILRFRVGDPSRDAARFDAVSPVRQAHRIQAPLFIVHAKDDERVPIEHADKLRSALDRHNKPYHWFELGMSGHNVRAFAGRLDLARALLTFLDRHIGPGSQAKAAAAPP